MKTKHLGGGRLTGNETTAAHWAKTTKTMIIEPFHSQGAPDTDGWRFSSYMAALQPMHFADWLKIGCKKKKDEIIHIPQAAWEREAYSWKHPAFPWGELKPGQSSTKLHLLVEPL